MISVEPNSREVFNALVAESARWRLVELLLERPRPGWRNEVVALAAEMPDSRLEAAVATIGDGDEGPYLAVFGPGGVASPREVAYRPMGDPGRILVELRGLYEAFGFRPRSEDPPDHVAVQVGFVGFMKLKQAYALAAGDTTAERRISQALEACLTEHLGGFVDELARSLERAGVEHLHQAASILKDLCPSVPSSRVPLPMVGPQTGVEDDLFTCDSRCGD